MSIESNFIKTIMAEDLHSGKVTTIITRFPPEPNAFLHIGHARSIFTNFLLANEFGGKTNLRFDDTNPAKEGEEFVNAIIEDLKWLGCAPDQVLFGSDYFEDNYNKAVLLINKGLAYVDDLSKEQIQEYRGTLVEPGKNSPYRERSIEENLRLFQLMREGAFSNGEKVLRAKIDMGHPNMNMRDPVLYRILHMSHHRQGMKWCIYPMYDFAHPLQDSSEKITHSICSLEYENHRILYDWVIENCECTHIPHQYEYGRLNINGMIMSKRYIRMLVNSQKVIGYDDPRLPTLVGLKKRGFTPEAIKAFILDTGLSRVNSTTNYEMLEHFIRSDLKLKTSRKHAVCTPLKVTITNYPIDRIEYLEAINNPETPDLGSRKLSFSSNLYIEREDFTLTPDKKWKRLAPGLEVRLMHAYFIKCNEVVYQNGEILELLCTYDVDTKSGTGFNERKPNGTIHYVDANTSIPATFNFYSALIDDNEQANILERVNSNSHIIKEGFVENSFKDDDVETRFQFVRNGYFIMDQKDKYVFNCICELKSSVK